MYQSTYLPSADRVWTPFETNRFPIGLFGYTFEGLFEIWLDDLGNKSNYFSIKVLFVKIWMSYAYQFYALVNFADNPFILKATSNSETFFNF